jgi:hypothetical protein
MCHCRGTSLRRTRVEAAQVLRNISTITICQIRTFGCVLRNPQLRMVRRKMGICIPPLFPRLKKRLMIQHVE